MKARVAVYVFVIGISALFAVPPVVAGEKTGIREVQASSHSVISLQTRLRYTTMILLPDGEEILDVICGDRDFWVISATHNIAHVKPAKAGAATNLNLVAASGTVYSFLLREDSKSETPDLKVYVNADPRAAGGPPKYFSAAQVQELREDLAKARAAADEAKRRADEAVAAYRQQYPTRLQFVYGTPEYERPFFVRAIWHDGKFTYVKTDARELPALYEETDGDPSLVNFQVHNGTYVIPKVLDRAYLSLGERRFEFEQER